MAWKIKQLIISEIQIISCLNYDFESKSQLRSAIYKEKLSCLNYDFESKSQQIATAKSLASCLNYDFESKSQLPGSPGTPSPCCLNYDFESKSQHSKPKFIALILIYFPNLQMMLFDK